MKKEYWKISEITNKKYDLFNVVQILNVKQAAFYSSMGLDLLHIELSEDRKTGEPVYVFYFNREESKVPFNEWCERRK